MSSYLHNLTFLLAFCQLVMGTDKPIDPSVNTRMKISPTMLDQQQNILQSDDKYVYDFSKNAEYSWEPGSVANANAATFPTLTGSGMTVAQLNLGPCAMLAPHLHRATNLVVAVTGTTHTYMIQENGARVVETKLGPGQMTVFPAASIHSMVNEGCERNQLYSFLNSEDAATTNIMNAFWRFGPDIGNRIMPMLKIKSDDWNETGKVIPAVGHGATSGYEACLKRCGL